MNSTKTITFFTTTAAIILVLALLAADTDARPSGRISRQKRVSDQRLAELETLLALEKIRGQLVTVPVAFGRVDPAKMPLWSLPLLNTVKKKRKKAKNMPTKILRGRRRRSSIDNGLERLQRLLEAAAAQESQSADQESDESVQSLFWDDVQDRREEETEEQLV